MNPNNGPSLNLKKSKVQIGVTANGKKKVKITALLLFKIKGGKKC